MRDALVLSLTSISRDIRSMRAQEVISYATYDQPNYQYQGAESGVPFESGFAESFGARLLPLEWADRSWYSPTLCGSSSMT